jgi:hypothetical protein
VQYVTRLTDTLGVSLGGTYQKQKNGFASFQGWGYNGTASGDSPPTYNGQTVYAPWGAQTEVKALTETRWSSTVALQWKPAPEWDVNADFLYSNVKINENQFQQWFGGWGDWGGTIPDRPIARAISRWPGAILWAPRSTTGNHHHQRHRQVHRGQEPVGHGPQRPLPQRRPDGEDGRFLFEALRNNMWAANEWNVYPQTVTFNTAANVVPSITTPVDLTAQSAQSYAGYGLTGPQRLHDTLGAAQVDATYQLHGGLFTSAASARAIPPASRASTRSRVARCWCSARPPSAISA